MDSLNLFIRVLITWCIAIISSHMASAAEWTLPTPVRAPVPLIPHPEKVVWEEGQLLFISLTPDVARLKPENRADIGKELGNVRETWKISHMPNGSRVVFQPVESVGSRNSEEAYSLTVTTSSIVISAVKPAGFFRGLQTLRQMIRPYGPGWVLPCCHIEDAPAFGLRGVMLDVSRNYIPIPLLKRITRQLACYKINTLHLHLTDDPAWRFEVKKYPQLISKASMWPTRQPGRYYTQAELKELIEWCTTLHMRVIPEIDMPGHSAAFTRAMGHDMQTPEGLKQVKQILDETMEVFPDPFIHLGTDEVHVRMADFLPEVASRVRKKGREPISWYPGNPPDRDSILMCWGENEAGRGLEGAKVRRYIDSNGFYLDWMDSQSGVLQAFFQQPCEVPHGDERALGGILAVWTDGALSSGERILVQYPFYPVALTFAERMWRGAREKRRDRMAWFPPPGTPEGNAFAEFEDRLIRHRDLFFRDEPFAYVRQSGMQWRLVGPFDHQGVNDRSFEPEQELKKVYLHHGKSLGWDTTAYGGAVWLRHLFAMFNMHRGQYRLDHWPTPMSAKLGKDPGTCYALACIESPRDQDIWLMVGLNGMWGHSGGYRTARAPEKGSWDFSGGNVWLNGEVLPPPDWKFASLPWSGWGKGRIESPLTEEGYFFRPPVKIHLRKGGNQLLVRSVFGHWKGDTGERKWFFCAMPVQWDGKHFREVTDLSYPDPAEILGWK